MISAMKKGKRRMRKAPEDGGSIATIPLQQFFVSPRIHAVLVEARLALAANVATFFIQGDCRYIVGTNFQPHRRAAARARFAFGGRQQHRAQAAAARRPRDRDRIQARALGAATEEQQDGAERVAFFFGDQHHRAAACDVPAELRAADLVVVETGLFQRDQRVEVGSDGAADVGVGGHVAQYASPATAKPFRGSRAGRGAGDNQGLPQVLPTASRCAKLVRRRQPATPNDGSNHGNNGMSRLVIVVEKASDWGSYYPSDNVVGAMDYLRGPTGGEERTHVINLCRGYKYLGTGHYVSLLGEARGHRVIPSVRTINDLRRRSLYGLDVEDLNQKLANFLPAGGRDTTDFGILVYFGETSYPALQDLARQVFEMYPCPLLRIEFE